MECLQKISTDEVHENVVIVGAHNVEQKVFDNIRVVASVPDYAIPSTSAEVNIDATTFSVRLCNCFNSYIHPFEKILRQKKRCCFKGKVVSNPK